MAAEIDAAWLRFRTRLADALAGFGDGDVLVIEVETGIPAEELEGAAPYVQFLCWDDGAALRAEVASNHYLDDRRALTPESVAALVGLGWAPATAEDRNFHAFGELRDADRLADLAVRTLREVHGVPHPAFLEAEGLELAPEPASPPADPALATLLELLHTGRVDTRAVAGLFDGDRLGIIRRIVAVRTHAASVDGHPEDVVLDHLRRALRYVVDGDLPERSRTGRRVPPRRTEQLSLVDDGDLGQGTLEVE